MSKKAPGKLPANKKPGKPGPGVINIGNNCDTCDEPEIKNLESFHGKHVKVDASKPGKIVITEAKAPVDPRKTPFFTFQRKVKGRSG